jgi:tRNA A-37 threonylcarbamoyl transferase component Bud32
VPPSSLPDAARLQEALRNLPRTGRLLKDRAYRQVWRFDFEGQGYYLKFYPRRWTLKRLLHGSPALAEFSGLQSLQQAGIPAPQAIALLMGFHLDSRLGDAVISQAIEPAQTLDRYLHPFELTAGPIPRRREIAAQLLHLLNALAKAHLGHADLHLGNFLLQENDGHISLFLLDGDAVRRGGLRRSHLFQLAHSLARYATRSDVQRGWELLGPGGRLPRSNPLSRRIWATFMRRITGENDYFGRLEPADAQGWSGVFFKQYKYPYRWSGLSQSRITRQDWLGAWPQLLQAIQADTLQVIKRSRSGDVLATRLRLGAQEVDVIVKRPRRRYWYRYVNEIGRGGRARRAWAKAWCLVIRNLPVAWPVLLMEKRRFGYVTDAVVVFERLPGSTLAQLDFNSLAASARDMLFRRLGRILRRIDDLGMAHFDAKSSNWIVFDDSVRGPTPVMIDPDSIRRRRWIALGVRRLLRSLRDHSQYTPEDSLALCQGYAPCARFEREQEA